MTTLITGAAGFVGLALAEHLGARGERVVAVDRADPPPRAKTLAGDIAWRQGDVTDRAGMVGLLREARADVLVHGAAITADAARDAAEPARIVEVNALGTARVLEAAREAGVSRVVHLSSGSAYGAAAFAGEALDEVATPALPESLYALTKFAGEGIARRLGALWDMDVRVARLSSVFGPWEHATGVRDTLSEIFHATRIAHERGAVVLPRPGARDWFSSRDAAAAIAALGDAPGPVPPVVNLGPGRVWTVADWLDALALRRPGVTWRIAAAGETPSFAFHAPQDRRPLAVERLAALGYRSSWTLERCLDDYLDWLAAEPG